MLLRPLLTTLAVLACAAPSPGSVTPGADRDAAAHSPAEAADSGQTEICLVVQNRIVKMSASTDPRTGDTIVAGQPLRALMARGSSPWAADSAWYHAHDPIRFAGQTYFKNSPPLHLSVDSLDYRGAYRGIPVFIDHGAPTDPPVILYVLISADCMFQAYYVTRDYRPVKP